MKSKPKPALKWKKKREENGEISFWAHHGTMLFAVYSWSKNGKIYVDLTSWADDGDKPTYEARLKTKGTMDDYVEKIETYQTLLLAQTVKALKLRTQLVRSFIG